MSKSISISNPDQLVSLVVEPSSGPKIGGTLNLSIFENAKSIDVSGNDFTDFGVLPQNLETFDCSQNKISNIPEIFEVSNKLQTVDLHENSLSVEDINRILLAFILIGDVSNISPQPKIDISKFGNAVPDSPGLGHITTLEDNGWNVVYNIGEYILSSDVVDSISEGKSFTISIDRTSSNVPDGTEVPYTITGIQEDDIVEPLIGYFIINNNTASATFTINTDVGVDKYKEGESFIMTLDGDNSAVTINIPIDDTTIAPYALTAVSSETEGNSFQVTISTTTGTAVPDGTEVPYTITGIQEDDITQPLTGNFILNNNTASITLDILVNLPNEENETLIIKLDDYPTSTSIEIEDEDIVVATQLGQDIDGESANDYSGYSVSMNDAGDRVAIGAIGNDDNGNSSGHTRIYEYSNGAWSQLGDDIDGEATSDRSGHSVSMNSTGDRVVIGALNNDGNGINSGHTRIYEWRQYTSNDVGSYHHTSRVQDNTQTKPLIITEDFITAPIVDNYYWTQLGDDIDGEATSDYSGYSVSINADGDRVAIGARFNDSINGADSGHTRIYEYTNGAWSQLGDDIDGEAIYDYSGFSVSINAVGDRVAIGAIGNDDNGSLSGHTKIYEYSNGTWTQLGQNINGEAMSDYGGYSVSINATGDRIAIGAPYNDGNGLSSGHARIYEYDGTYWTQLGQDINGEAANDYSGFSVSINAAGDRVAIGAFGNDDNGFLSGHTRIYEYDVGTQAWSQLGDDIDGEATSNQSARSVSINADGDRVAIGALYNAGNGSGSGHTRVFVIE